jgi:hypothetical protein
MKYSKIKTVLALTLISSGLQCADVFAESPKMYGEDSPSDMSDLPADNKLWKKLESLPEHVKQKAKENLHKFSFPESDTEFLRIDEEGGIYYEDAFKPKPINGKQNVTATTLTVLPAVDTFKLHSRPNSTKKVFLDFDGHDITGTAWNSGGAAIYRAVAFDTDGSPTSFSTDERARIAEVWHRVAEDYALFDIDVTTEEPAFFNATTGRIVFTKDVDAAGIAMPAQGAGGVAYVGVFGAVNYATYYSPALVYSGNLGPNHPPYMAEAASHEFGHNLGLSHDGVLDGQQNPKCLGSTGYFCGLGTGFVSWGPIMGVGYYTNVTEWSKGEYPSANNTQDDISIISSKLLLINDGDDGSFLTAQPLAVEIDGSVLSTTPQNDPSNADSVNKGIIESRTDVDSFWFDSGAGNISLKVEPAWAAYYRSSTRGANLDIEAKLYDQAGNLLTSNDSTSETNATVSATIPAGRYYLTVGGVGNTVTPYSDYGSLGEYFISGYVVSSSTDTTAPKPNPTSANQAPTASNDTATVNEDNNVAIAVLSNDSDPDRDTLTIASTTTPAHGTATITANVVNYKPAANYNGSDSFSYTINDGFGGTATASVSVTVTPVNDNPVAVNDSVAVVKSKSISISPLGNDTDNDRYIDGSRDTLAITAIGNPTKGTAVWNSNVITYTAGTKAATDSFSYTISDGKGGTATGTITVSIKNR